MVLMQCVKGFSVGLAASMDTLCEMMPALCPHDPIQAEVCRNEDAMEVL